MGRFNICCLLFKWLQPAKGAASEYCGGLPGYIGAHPPKRSLTALSPQLGFFSLNFRLSWCPSAFCFASLSISTLMKLSFSFFSGSDRKLNSDGSTNHSRGLLFCFFNTTCDTKAYDPGKFKDQKVLGSKYYQHLINSLTHCQYSLYNSLTFIYNFTSSSVQKQTNVFQLPLRW